MLEEEISQKTQFYRETLDLVTEKERKFDEGKFSFNEKTRFSCVMTQGFKNEKKQIEDQLEKCRQRKIKIHYFNEQLIGKLT